jgi:hypothetical protein
MINRFFNQSCRMLLLALQALALADTGTPPVEPPAPASPEAIAP